MARPEFYGRRDFDDRRHGYFGRGRDWMAPRGYERGHRERGDFRGRTNAAIAKEEISVVGRTWRSRWRRLPRCGGFHGGGGSTVAGAGKSTF